MSEARLAVATNELREAQNRFDEKEAELRRVQDMYDSAMAEKQALLDDAEACKRKMDAASALISGLGGEKIRWTNQSKEFKASIDRSVGSRRRRPNLGLVCFVLMFPAFLVKDACLFSSCRFSFSLVMR